jgi:thiol:disulfide interchange protein DsbC
MSFNQFKFNLSILNKAKVLLSLIIAFAFSSSLSAQTIEEKISDKLSNSNARVEVTSVEESPWKGMYEVSLTSGEIIFSDKNAEYLVVGQLLNLNADNQVVNLSEQKFQVKVADTLERVSSDEQIIYPAKGEQKAFVTVFTDISCYYCKKLHKAIPELQKNGVTVKYMAFPRAGLGSDIEKQMSAIWCAKDKLEAMDVAKKTGKITAASCDSPVASQFRLGHQLGVNATPTLFTEQGVKIAGFSTASDLLDDLNVPH